MKPVNVSKSKYKIKPANTTPNLVPVHASKLNRILEKSTELHSTSTLHGLSRLTKAFKNKKLFDQILFY